MTVNQSALFIALGTGNMIANLDPQTYKKDWVVYVTDSNGVAVPNINLTIKVLPVDYRKGVLVFADGGWGYDPTPATSSCARTRTRTTTAFSTPGDEDFNRHGKLQPGNVISVTTALIADGVCERVSPGPAPTAERRSPCSTPRATCPGSRLGWCAGDRLGNRVFDRSSSSIVDGLAADFNSATRAAGRRGQPVRRQRLHDPELTMPC